MVYYSDALNNSDMCLFSSRRRHTICALVTGVQTCALPISIEYMMNPFTRDRRQRAPCRAARPALCRRQIADRAAGGMGEGAALAAPDLPVRRDRKSVV